MLSCFRVVLITLLCVVLTSCSTSIPKAANANASATVNASGSLRGGVHGGQQPVFNATIQLWAVGTGSVASAATPLLTQTVTSDHTGAFTIGSLYTCPSAGSLVYISAVGGDPGLGGSTYNSSIALFAALGTCGSLSSSTFINLNEVTTVAAITALAPYMTSLSHVGASSYPALVAAFGLANSLANTTSGFSSGPALAGGMLVPTAQLNTLADVIASCINSAGGVAGDGSACGTLFANAGGSGTTDTIAALLHITANPTSNTTALFNLASANGPFQPSLGSAPSSWAIQITAAPYTATPVITPSTRDVLAGQVFTVTITDSTPGAVIYYTLTGSNPTTSSPVYTGPFQTSASGSTTVIAFAVAPDSAPSTFATGGTRMQGYVSTPIFSPAGGVVTPGQAVSITDDTPGVTLYYTLDGTTPTASSPVYTGTPITITGAITINIYATASGYTDNYAAAKYAFAPSGTQPYIYTVAGGGPVHTCTTVFPPTECPGYYGDPGPATSVNLGINLNGVAIDPAGNIYIASGRLLKVDASTGILKSLGPGCTNFFTPSGDNGPVGSACFNANVVATDSAGNIYIGEGDGTPGRVRKVNAATGIITTVAGGGPGGDGGLATNAYFGQVSGLVIDSAGNLYISVQTDNNVRRVDAVTGIISTVAGTGTAGFSGDSSLAISAQLNGPYGLALNAAGDLFIADSGNGRVRRVDHTSGIITTFAGGSSSLFYDDGVPATSSVIQRPGGLAIDGTGNLYISDWGNNSPLPIRKVDTSGIITTVAGQNPDGSVQGMPANLASLYLIHSLAVDPSGNLYMPDGLHGSIIREIVFH